jgi:hypothetical protein
MVVDAGGAIAEDGNRSRTVASIPRGRLRRAREKGDQDVRIGDGLSRHPQEGGARNELW